MGLTLGNKIGIGSIQKGALLNLKYAKLINASVVSADAAKNESWPSIGRDISGVLYTVYRTSNNLLHTFDSTGRVVIRTSQDNGNTWGAEITVADNANWDDRDPNILIFNNTILVTYVSWNNINRKLLCKKATIGSNPNFGSEIIIDSEKGTSRGLPIKLTNGDIIVPYYDNNNLYYAKSGDDGDTWINITGYVGVLTLNESCVIEVKINAMFSGKIISVSRNITSPYQAYITTSLDFGETWGEPTIMFTPDIDNPVQIIRMDNNLLMFCNDLQKGVIYISRNEGISWEYFSDWMSKPDITYTRMYPCAVKITTSEIGVAWSTNGSESEIFFYLIKLSINQIQDIGLKSSLFGVYEFEEESNSRYLIDKINGNVMLSTDFVSGVGKLGKCNDLNGTSSRMAHLKLLNEPPNEFSISLWFNVNSLSATGFLIAKTNVINSDRMFLTTGSTGLVFGYEVNNLGYFGLTISASISTGTWYHCVFSWSKTHGFKAILNGVKTVENLSMITMMSNKTDGVILSIGCNNMGGNLNFFNGKIEQFAFWNRWMEDNETLQLYNEGNGLPTINW